MDTITISKLTSIFRDDSPYDLELLMTKDEIKELEKNRIIYKDSNDLYLLNKKSLYLYSKKARDAKNYDIAIIILEYLASWNAKENEEWVRTNHYQLFKNYFLKGNIKLSYEYFMKGFDEDSKMYPIVLNMFRYLLKKHKVYMDLDDDIALLISENKFDQLKDYVNKYERIPSHRDFYDIILDKIDKRRKDIINKLKDYINNGELELALDFMDEVKKDNRFDSSLKYIYSLVYNFNLLKKETISEVRLIDLAAIIDLYRSNCFYRIVEDSGIDLIYQELLKDLLIEINTYIRSSRYRDYVNNSAAISVNRLNNKCGVLIIDNLEQNNNKNYLKLAKKRKNVSIDQIDNYYGKRIVLSSNLEETASLEEIKQLYSEKDYRKCLKKCLCYISLDPRSNKDGYYYAALCYDKLDDDRQSILFLDCYNFLSLRDFNSIGEKINRDANFYGIYNIEEIINFSNKHNISLDLACIHFGLNEEQIELVKLLIAKNYYGIGDYHNGEYYYNSVSDNSTSIIQFKREINNKDTYRYVDYEESKKFIDLLERKK